ncbi:penicillin-binding protein 2 [Lentimicrobium sp. S6]|uniref:penicillin-binding protein 2 n=1 Tax=Lentimicrobium sp. S6 TaxID=2735872 RepID=UPI001551D835|nr:penicillin-binding protein 2 [Lentimicrobium sp. S6]NPD44459.1 penicillin-binding protein 2 [Lentimicrobium sp. S6]
MKKNYSDRKFIMIGVISIIGMIFLARLFYVQIIEEEYALSADSNVIRKNIIYPARGIIYDRNEKIMVANNAAYDLMVIPRQLKDFDTTRFCSLLQISNEEFIRRMDKAKKYSRYKASLFLGQIPKEEFSYLQETLYDFSGFYVQERTLRRYPYRSGALNLGDIGEVNRKDLDRDAFYRSGDYIGKSGIEKFYEKELRGEKGVEYVMVDVMNRKKGKYKEGRFDTLAVNGKSLYTSLDAELQLYGELLMKNKLGSIVAIEPATGEILSLVSSPSYDPSILVGRNRGKNFNLLLHDTLKPLYNRALMAAYPPGSTFKMLNALIALDEHVVTINTEFSCQGTVSKPIKCSHNHITPLGMIYGIQQSCNPYFWNTFRNTLNNPKAGSVKKGFENWSRKVRSFGLGTKFNTDLMYEKSGMVPSVEYYDKVYRGVWNALTVRSLAIGQGELLITPLQLANLTAAIANRGFYFRPHLVKSIGEPSNIISKYNEKQEVEIKAEHFAPIVEGMRRVVQVGGTARRGAMDSVTVCGKTGTVQNPHGDDHSIFIAFAPMDNPRIAIAVVVENAGDFGGTWAAPIASLMMEKYLNGVVIRKEKEKRILEADLITPD